MSETYTTLRHALNNQDNRKIIELCKNKLRVMPLDDPMYIPIICILSETLTNMGNGREAINLILEPKVQDKKNSQHIINIAWLYVSLASAYRSDLDILESISYAKLALSHLSQIVDLNDRILLTKDPQLSIFTPTGKKLLSDSFEVLGSCYTYIGELKLAWEYINKAISARRLTNIPAPSANSYFTLGLVLLRQGNYQDAIAQLYKALELLQNDYMNYLTRGKLEINIGATFGFLGEVEKGIALTLQGVSHISQSGSLYWLSIAETNLAYLYMQRGDLKSALNILEKLEHSLDALKYPIAKINALMTLSEVSAIQGNKDKAVKLIRECLKYIKTVKDENCKAQTLLTAGRVYLISGILNEAEINLQSCLNSSKKIGSRGDMITAILFLAEIKCEQEDFLSARDIIQPYIHAIDTIKSKETMAHWRELMGRIEFSFGNLSKAFIYLKQSVTLWTMTGNLYRLGKCLCHFSKLAYVGEGIDARKLVIKQAKYIANYLSSVPLELYINKVNNQNQNFSMNKISQSQRNEFFIKRLLLAKYSKELLLHELALFIYNDICIKQIIIFSSQEGVIINQGINENKAKEVVAYYSSAPDKKCIHKLGNVVLPITVGDNNSIYLYIHQQLTEKDIDLINYLIELIGPLLDGVDHRQKQKDAYWEFNILSSDHIPLPNIIYASQSICKVADYLHRIRGSKRSVLIMGESGTGKELVAKAIHLLSSRADKPFRAINCAAIPETMFESSLFGHRRGAFTGATENSSGFIREAEGGTLFLDEVGEIPLSLQAKLLRFLQENEIQVLGDPKPHKVDVRIIAATNRNIRELVAKGLFREDLFYRLNILEISLPPLRDRIEDIPLLVNHFLEKFSQEENKAGIEISKEAVGLLLQYNWPGNIRELSNEIQRLIAITPEHTRISVSQLSPSILQTINSKEDSTQSESLPQRTSNLKELKVLAVSDALKQTNWNISKAAKELGLTRNGLYKIIDKYHLSPK